jgi:WD40 repeat protein
LCLRFILLLVVPGLCGCSITATQPPTHVLANVHPGGAQRIAFSPSGRWLASAGLHGEVMVWSVAEGKLWRPLPAHRSAVRGLAWRDESHLFSVDSEGELRLYDLGTGRVQSHYLPGPVQAMVITSDRRYLLLGQASRVLRVDAAQLRVEAQSDVGGKVISVAVDAAVSQLAVATADGRVLVGDRQLSRWRELERPPTDAKDLHFSPQGRRLLAGGWFRLRDWDVRSGNLVSRPTPHPGQVISVDISPDAQTWLTLGRQTDSSLYLIDAQTNRVLRRMQAHELCGWQARFSPDGRYAASAGEEGSIHIYDLNAPYRPVTVWGAETE